MNIIKTTPCVYELTWTKGNKRYIGVKFGKGSKPTDIGTIYFGSGEAVKQYRSKHGDPDKVSILKQFETVDTYADWVRVTNEAYEYERSIIIQRNAIHDFNYLNNGAGFAPYFTPTDEHRQKLSVNNGMKTVEAKKKLSMIGLNRPQVTCPHCNKTGSRPPMLHWHFDNCKQRPSKL